MRVDEDSLLEADAAIALQDDVEKALEDFAKRKLASLDKGIKTKGPKRKVCLGPAQC